jgi:thiol:disulfide interchange protein
MNLASDSFEIEYDGNRSSVSDCLGAIRALGFNPRVVARGSHTQRRADHPGGPIPEPIASALTRANQRGQLLFVEFYADWCAPCRLLDESVFPDPAIRKALNRFQKLRVDTDRHPKAGEAMGITTLPTLVILDEEGKEVGRMAGLIDRSGLLGWLDEVQGAGIHRETPIRTTTSTVH